MTLSRHSWSLQASIKKMVSHFSELWVLLVMINGSDFWTTPGHQDASWCLGPVMWSNLHTSNLSDPNYAPLFNSLLTHSYRSLLQDAQVSCLGRVPPPKGKCPTISGRSSRMKLWTRVTESTANCGHRWALPTLIILPHYFAPSKSLTFSLGMIPDLRSMRLQGLPPNQDE